MTTLYLFGFPPEVDAEAARLLLSQFGTLDSLSFHRAAHDRSRPGFGFADMPPREAQAVIKDLDGRPFAGAMLQVREANATDQDSPAVLDTDGLPGDEDLLVLARPGGRYRLESVEPVGNPDGDGCKEWYRYVLAAGRSRIVGIHSGSHEEVTAYALDCAENFNSRSFSGRTGLAWSSSRKR